MAIKGYQFKQTGKEIQVILDGAVMQMQSVTYAELVALRDGGKLVAGQWYRITDYVTSVSQTPDDRSGMAMIRSAGHPFDIIVRADASGTLNETSFAAPHARDTYFAGQRMEAWRLSYCLDNDTERFPWCDPTGTGVIYWMRDEKGNDCQYDFKNVQFLRFQLNGPAGMDSRFLGAPVGQYFADRQITDGSPLSVHCYEGYFKESVIAEDYTDKWDGTYVLQNDGTRLFAVVGANRFNLIVEVKKSTPLWFYTFCDENRADASVTGYSLGNVIDSSVEGLPNVVFMGNARNNRVFGCHDCTFGESEGNTMEDVANSAYSYAEASAFKGIASSWFEHIRECSFSGTIDTCHFEELLHCDIHASVDSSTFPKMHYCRVDSADIYESSFYYDEGDQTEANFAMVCGRIKDKKDIELYGFGVFHIVSLSDDGSVSHFTPSAQAN